MSNAESDTGTLIYQRLAERLDRHGLALRGGFHPDAADVVPSDLSFGTPGTIVLVGVLGPRTWTFFERERWETDNPLDSWTRRVVDAVAEEFGAVSVHPNDKPYQPFQQWAKRSEPLFQSPLGLLIHPQYGLWHSYRAALLFADRIELPAQADAVSPCDSCEDKPCLSACPVGAFTGEAYDVPRCVDYLALPSGQQCLEGGCQARDACPVGRDYRYSDAQIRFHMDAFSGPLLRQRRASV